MFPPCFRFPPLFRKIFGLSRKFSTFLLFRISLLFSLFQYISPLFRENYYFLPALTIFPPLLHKFTCFLHTFRVFHFPPTFTMMHFCITQCTYWTPLFVTGGSMTTPHLSSRDVLRWLPVQFRIEYKLCLVSTR